MKPINSFNIRMLTLNDLEDWLKQCEILDSESGENNIYYGPYNSDESYSIDRLRKKHKKLCINDWNLIFNWRGDKPYSNSSPSYFCLF